MSASQMPSCRPYSTASRARFAKHGKPSCGAETPPVNPGHALLGQASCPRTYVAGSFGSLAVGHRAAQELLVIVVGEQRPSTARPRQERPRRENPGQRSPAIHARRACNDRRPPASHGDAARSAQRHQPPGGGAQRPRYIPGYMGTSTMPQATLAGMAVTGAARNASRGRQEGSRMHGPRCCARSVVERRIPD